MKNIPIIFILILIGVGGYFLLNPKPKTAPSQENTTSTTPAPTIDNNDLMQGGSSYSDVNGLYTFLYPSDYKLDIADPVHIRIYKYGATQTGQTEMYDGVLIVFEDINLGNKSLSQWVDDNIKTTTADGTLKIIEPKKSITINNYPGFTYSTQGLGEAKYYVLQKDSSSKNAVVITTAVMDPKNVGFQKEVDKTLSTLQLLK